jgi:hypothetical protein
MSQRKGQVRHFVKAGGPLLKQPTNDLIGPESGDAGCRQGLGQRVELSKQIFRHRSDSIGFSGNL